MNEPDEVTNYRCGMCDECIQETRQKERKQKEETLVVITADFVKNVVIKIEYVHELQNLYFILTGKELIFKKSI